MIYEITAKDIHGAYSASVRVRDQTLRLKGLKAKGVGYNAHVMATLMNAEAEYSRPFDGELDEFCKWSTLLYHGDDISIIVSGMVGTLTFEVVEAV